MSTLKIKCLPSVNNTSNKSSLIFSIGILVLLSIWMITITIMVKSNEVTERTIACASENKTYIHITLIEGLPAKIDYCGDVRDIKGLVEEMRSESST